MRLTEKHFDGKGYYMRCSQNCCHTFCDDCTELDKLVNRLGELEDKEERGGDAVPVVPGRWIKDGDVVVCSECGAEHAWEEYRATYCEDCGAKMDGGNEDG